MSLFLTVKTDSAKAELTLFDGTNQLSEYNWQADRQLAETLHTSIVDFLHEQKLNLKDLNGIAIYKGPGSFTGLRIGISSCNALASSLNIPIVGTTAKSWQTDALNRLKTGQDARIVLPIYDSEPRTT